MKNLIFVTLALVAGMTLGAQTKRASHTFECETGRWAPRDGDCNVLLRKDFADGWCMWDVKPYTGIDSIVYKFEMRRRCDGN